MQEIKFRAFDEIENRFWYFTLQEILERKMSYSGSWDYTILKSKKDTYTGVKDYKCKEIFQNDLVVFARNEKNKYLVVFNGGAYKLKNIKYPNENLHLLDDMQGFVKVIGNAYGV